MPKKRFTITIEADLAHAEFPTWYNPKDGNIADFSDYEQLVIIGNLVSDGLSRADLRDRMRVLHPEPEERYPVILCEKGCREDHIHIREGYIEEADDE